MYLIEQISRLQADGRDDTVSVHLPSLDEESLSPETVEAMATFMRMAATFAKSAGSQDQAEWLEEACRVLNRVMDDCSRRDQH